jgi:hypothetical protein
MGGGGSKWGESVDIRYMAQVRGRCSDCGGGDEAGQGV